MINSYYCILIFFVLVVVVLFVAVAVAAAVSPRVKVILHETIRNDDFFR